MDKNEQIRECLAILHDIRRRLEYIEDAFIDAFVEGEESDAESETTDQTIIS